MHPLAFALLGILAPSPARTDWEELRAIFAKGAREDGIVGSSLFVTRDGTVLAREFHGMADLETRRPVDEDTIYHWGSITKTLTAIAILQLRDRGLLNLEDSIVRTVPEVAAVHDPHGKIEDVTIRHLLSHSAGFRMRTWPWGGEEPWHPFEPTQWSQLVAMMPYTEVLFAPGSRYSYSNLGIVFLGRVIEKLSGDDYEVYVEKNLFKPLGMHRSYFDRTPYHLLRHRSNNYSLREGVPRANGLDFDTGITVSNGGLNAPIPDLVKYLAFLAGSPDLTEEARGVLARSSLEEMWRPQVPVETEPGGTRVSMGLSFFLLEKDGRRLVGHTGSQAGFRAFFYVEPGTRTGVIAAYNTAGEAGDGPPVPRVRFAELRTKFLEAVAPAVPPAAPR
jgi:CubicO group peptidase (beta-lactamase class C family)